MSFPLRKGVNLKCASVSKGDLPIIDRHCNLEPTEKFTATKLITKGSITTPDTATTTIAGDVVVCGNLLAKGDIAGAGIVFEDPGVVTLPAGTRGGDILVYSTSSSKWIPEAAPQMEQFELVNIEIGTGSTGASGTPSSVFVSTSGYPGAELDGSIAIGYDNNFDSDPDDAVIIGSGIYAESSRDSVLIGRAIYQGGGLGFNNVCIGRDLTLNSSADDCCLLGRDIATMGDDDTVAINTGSTLVASAPNNVRLSTLLTGFTMLTDNSVSFALDSPASPLQEDDVALSNSFRWFHAYRTGLGAGSTTILTIPLENAGNGGIFEVNIVSAEDPESSDNTVVHEYVANGVVCHVAGALMTSGTTVTRLATGTDASLPPDMHYTISTSGTDLLFDYQGHPTKTTATRILVRFQGNAWKV